MKYSQAALSFFSASCCSFHGGAKCFGKPSRSQSRNWSARTSRAKSRRSSRSGSKMAHSPRLGFTCGSLAVVLPCCCAPAYMQKNNVRAAAGKERDIGICSLLVFGPAQVGRSEEHTSELQSLR